MLTYVAWTASLVNSKTNLGISIFFLASVPTTLAHAVAEYAVEVLLNSEPEYETSFELVGCEAT